jgi:hypothetical protein
MASSRPIELQCFSILAMERRPFRSSLKSDRVVGGAGTGPAKEHWRTTMILSRQWARISWLIDMFSVAGAGGNGLCGCDSMAVSRTGCQN